MARIRVNGVMMARRQARSASLLGCRTRVVVRVEVGIFECLPKGEAEMVALRVATTMRGVSWQSSEE